jgi:hypothetical protein
MVDLHDVQGVLNDERAGRNSGIGATGGGHAAAAHLGIASSLEAAVNCRAGRAGHLLQSAKGTDLFDKIYQAQGPGLFTHDADRFGHGSLLLSGKARRKQLEASTAACDGRSLADVAKSGAVAIDSRTVYAEAFSNTIRCRFAQRQVGDAAQRLGDVLQVNPSLLVEEFQRVWRPTSNRKCVCGAAFGGHDALRQGLTCTQFIRSNCNVDAEFAFNQKDSLPKYNLTEMGQRSPTTRANASDPAFGPFADYSFIFAEYSYFDNSVEPTAASKQNGEQLVISVIDSAKFEIRMLASNFTSKPIARALLRASSRGVDVKVLVDQQNAIHSDYGSAKRVLGYLAAAGIDVRLLSVSPAVHDCAIVVDDHIVQFGAANYSSNARLSSEDVSMNWDSRELAATYEGYFQRHSDAAQPLRAQ